MANADVYGPGWACLGMSSELFRQPGQPLMSARVEPNFRKALGPKLAVWMCSEGLTSKPGHIRIRCRQQCQPTGGRKYPRRPASCVAVQQNEAGYLGYSAHRLSVRLQGGWALRETRRAA